MRPRVPGSTGCFPLGNEEKQELQEKKHLLYCGLGGSHTVLPHASVPLVALCVCAHTHPRSIATVLVYYLGLAHTRYFALAQCSWAVKYV